MCERVRERAHKCCNFACNECVRAFVCARATTCPHVFTQPICSTGVCLCVCGRVCVYVCMSVCVFGCRCGYVWACVCMPRGIPQGTRPPPPRGPRLRPDAAPCQRAAPPTPPALQARLPLRRPTRLLPQGCPGAPYSNQPNPNHGRARFTWNVIYTLKWGGGLARLSPVLLPPVRCTCSCLASPFPVPPPHPLPHPSFFRTLLGFLFAHIPRHSSFTHIPLPPLSTLSECIPGALTP